METKLYKLAIWYIGKFNAERDKEYYKRCLKQLDRLTFRNGGSGKAYLLYGCDAEWQNFSRYEVLNNAIQKLAEYEDAKEEAEQKLASMQKGE